MLNSKVCKRDDDIIQFYYNNTILHVHKRITHIINDKKL